MKYNPGDVLTHRYDPYRMRYMGIGYILKINLEQTVIQFTKLASPSTYLKKSMYNLELYTDFFREEE